MSKTNQMLLIFSTLALLLAVGSAWAESVGVRATVAATYSCEIKGFDLWCQTNAQRVIINGEEIN